jgi:predicted nucleic acid-binding Zn ribbon protein
MFCQESDSPNERRGPRKLSELIPQLMARRGYARLLSHDEILGVWEQASGALSGQSRPGMLRRNVLEIIVTNSVAMQELTFQKQQLLMKLSRQLPHHQIRDLRFSIGSID